MTYKFLLIFFIVLVTNTIKVQNEEISLYNTQGKAVAYIATEDMTIFTWSGKPIAYLTNDNNDKFNIYGFNGKHLGWFIKGIIRDHDGNITGFIKDAVHIPTEFEPYKGYKQYKPYKSFKEYPPYMPFPSNNFSNTPLSLFLAQGVDD